MNSRRAKPTKSWTPVTHAAWLTDALAPDRELRDVGGGVLSALDPHEECSPYDRRAATYDRLIGSRLYNRLIWGASPAAYTAFAAESIASSDGPLLDVGCGTAIFTAQTYRSTARPLVLLDRSLGMLRRAVRRLEGHHTKQIAFVQADLFALPFQPGSFTTVACHGLPHLFDDPGRVLGRLRSQLATGGSLYASSLVAQTTVGSAMLRVLHRVGETAEPRQEHELAALANSALGDEVRTSRQGCMAFLRLP